MKLGTKSQELKKGGYSFIEAMVVIGIIGLLTVIVVNSQSDFEQGLTISNLQQQMMGSVRKAQTYGLNVRKEEDGTGHNASYGLYFTETERDTYYIYEDIDRGDNPVTWWVPNDGVFKYVDGVSGKLETFTLPDGYEISNVCVRKALQTLHCLDIAEPDVAAILPAFSGGGVNVSEVSITFDRPRPDAYFATDATSAIDTTFTAGYISLRHIATGKKRVVGVGATGYIFTPIY